MKYGYNCATPPPRMSAPSSICSDDSFEKLDPEELQDDAQPMYKPKVTFHEVFDVYPMDADIVARVTFDDDYVKSDKDTAIVVPLAWKSVDQALCATKIDGNHVRFDVKELPKTGAEEIFYQLCYCTEDKIVMGVSIPFLFREVREDELIEFQKERNNEFWTFRSRFAVLMDIYWNFVVESKLKCSTTDEVTTGELAEVLNGDKKENSTESDVDRTSRVLLFQIMKLDLEEMKKQCEEMKTQYEEEKNKNEKLFSLIKSLFKPFSATERQNCIEMMKKLFAMYPEESFEYHSSYMGVIIKMIKTGQHEAIIEKQANDAEKKKIMLLLQLLRIVFTGCKFTSSINRDTCVNFLREWEHLFNEEKSDLERLISMIRYDGDFAPKDIQSNEEAHQDVIRCNAHFVATSSCILLAPECDKETPLKSAVVAEGVGNNVPDDWKAEKASLLEKCSKLEVEINTKDEIIKGLQEKLINQEQGEVEKVIAATDKVHETYAREMKKLVAANKSIGELLRAKEEERKLMMARVEIPIVSMEAEIEDKEKIIETLKEEIAQHEETYEIFINKLDSQMKEIKEANKKMAELNELLAKKDDTISNLERQLVNFNTHTCEASSARRVVELEERLQTVYTTLWDERREMIKLRDSLQILQAQLNSLRDKPKKAVWKRGDVLGNLALIKATRPFRLSERLPMLPDYSKSQASTSSQGEDKSKMIVSSKFSLFEKVVDEQTNPGSQSTEETKQSAESPTTQARRKKLLQDLGEAMCQLNHQIVVLRRELKSEKLKVSELTKENEDLKQHAEEFKDLYSKSEVAESGVDKLREEMENLRKNARDLEEKMKIMAEEKAAEKHEYDVLKALHKKTVADLEAKLKDAQLNRSIEENAAYAKLVEEREAMLDLHSKEVLNLEARLKEGAKQYAKLYMKYEKLARSSQSSNLNSLT